MVRRLIPIAVFASVLIVTSLAATIAQTRMVAAGVFCGPGSARILLDDRGLPILDAEGRALAAPECLACHLKVLTATAAAHAPEPVFSLGASPMALQVVNQTPSMVMPGGQARAPPLRLFA